MRVSVAMATYNGGRYLATQLDSLAAQTRLPDELVITDDCSKDDTVEIARAFAKRAPFPVRVEVNEAPLRMGRNFQRAASLCEGDVILFCDHDDRWHADKVERIERAFLARPDAGVVFMDADVTGPDLEPKGYTFWQGMGFGEDVLQAIEREPLDVLLRQFVVQGAAMGFRAPIREKAFPVQEGWAHDAWLSLVAALDWPFVALRETGLDYRQHGGNAIGVRPPGAWERARSVLRMRLASNRALLARDVALWGPVLPRLEAMATRPAARERLADLRERIGHYQARMALPRNPLRRVGPVMREARAGRYARHSAGVGSAIKDVLLR